MSGWTYNCPWCDYGSDTKTDVDAHKVGCKKRPARNPRPR
jgi:hypothetical protein